MYHLIRENYLANPVLPNQLAIPNNRSMSLLASGKVGFRTGCAVFSGGVSRPMNGRETKAADCEDNDIMVQNVSANSIIHVA